MRIPRISRTMAVVALIALLPAVNAAHGADAPTATPAQAPTAPSIAGSWTARVLFPTAIHKTPAGKVIDKARNISTWTQDPAVYLITESAVVNGTQWIRILLPGRPNGRQGWIRQDAAVLKVMNTWVRVSTKKRTMEIYVNGQLKKRVKVAVGTGGTPTPKGLAAVQDVVPTRGQLGPYILVLTAHSTVLKTFAGGNGVVGIHGWPSASAIGKAVSHGCVRMTPTGVRLLVKHAKMGTPIEVV